MIEQLPGSGEPAVFAVGSEKRSPGDDIGKGEVVEDGLGLVDFAAASALGDLGVAEGEIGAGFGVGRGGFSSQLGKWEI